MHIWQTKDWKKRRQAIVCTVKACEWCKVPFDEKNIPTIHHLKDHKAEAEAVWKQALNREMDFLIQEKIKGIPPPPPEFETRCSSCDYRRVQHRKRTNDWICRACGMIFDKEPQVEITMTWKSRFYQDLWKTVWEENKERLKRMIYGIQEDSFSRYKDMIDDEVVVICKKCHFLKERHGIRSDDPRHKCPSCGGIKMSQAKETCFRCFLKTKEGYEWSKQVKREGINKRAIRLINENEKFKRD